MRKLLVVSTLLFAALFAGGALRADAPAPFEESLEDPPLPAAEFITGTPIVPAPGHETPQKDPFAPYDIGDPASAIPYEALSPEEKAVVDKGRDVSGWRQIHDAYASAVGQRAKQARAEAAVHQLGLDELATKGVVP
jgi:hypothetical protein